MKRNFLLFLLLFANLIASAQQYRPYNSTQIYDKINALYNLNTVMYVAAHPDDENTRLLSFLVHEAQLHTIYLSLTRGDGGQNLIGTELGTELGLIRNYELIAARKIDGAAQIFGNVLDFGYSKNDKETFMHWNKQSLVDDIKKAIQLYKPSLIICRFPVTGEGGHGQHTASAIATVEAYHQIKEESKYNKNIFIPTRVIFNAFQFGNRSTIKESQTKLITNQYNSLLGESYGEMAGTSRSIHRSQGVGTPQSIGKNFEYFELMAGAEMVNSIFDNIDFSWAIINAQHLKEELKNIINQYSFSAPHKSLDQLIALRKKINAEIKNDFYRYKMIGMLDPIILSCNGIMIDVLNDKEFVTKNDSLNLTTRIIARNIQDQKYCLDKVMIDEKVLLHEAKFLQNDTVLQFQNYITIPNDKEIDQPYWLKTEPINNRFVIDENDFSKPNATPQLLAKFDFLINGEKITAQVPVSFKYLDPLKGDVIKQVHIVPELSISPEDEIIFGTKSNPTYSTKIQIQAFEKIENGKLLIYFHKKNKQYGENNPAIKNQPSETSILHNIIENINIQANKKLTLPLHLKTQVDGYYSYYFVHRNDTSSLNQKVINYDHLPTLVHYQKPKSEVASLDFIIPEGKFGYIEGAGDLVLQTLKKTGLNIDLIPNEKLGDIDYLSQYKSIIVGIRAYNSNEQLIQNNDILLAYLKNGGKVVVQYNTSNHLLLPNFAPYPISIGRDRVTMEDAAVKVTNPTHAILNFPNKISAEDFDGWVQERGLYFPSKIDAKYQTLFEMNDNLDGEVPLANAIIHAKYGKGNYIYTGLSFFRQLPAAHKGAIKLFLNMIE